MIMIEALLTDKTGKDIASALQTIAQNGTSAQNAEKLAQEAKDLITALVGNVVYGVRHYYKEASPVLIRLGANYLHQTLPVQSLMRRCLVTDNGDVKYLHPTDSTKMADGSFAVLDGSAGQVMVEIPEHYRKFVSSDTYYDCLISLMPFEGAHKVNKCYISAYEASLDRAGSKLASVVNTTANYRGGGNQAGWDNTYRSVLGRPVTSVSLTSFRTYANNRGTNWKCQEWDTYNAVFWLYTVEYANLNCQAEFNASLTSEGYHQGGLGAGVTTLDSGKWNTFNGYYPFVPCGYTNSLGNNTGTAPFNMPSQYGSLTVNVPSYRGIENPFGHIWKWTDGVLAKGNGTIQEYYKTTKRASYSSTLNSDYSKIGESPTANGYKKEILRNAFGDIMTTNSSGSDTTYFCDYHYQAVANGTIYGFLSGGSAYPGSLAGFCYLASNLAPAHTDPYFGSRLCYCDKATILE